MNSNRALSLNKDIVCCMDVKLDSPFHTEYQGNAYYFCSDHCLKKFVT
jgi:Cu+-exporting ATPase